MYELFLFGALNWLNVEHTGKKVGGASQVHAPTHRIIKISWKIV